MGRVCFRFLKSSSVAEFFLLTFRRWADVRIILSRPDSHAEDSEARPASWGCELWHHSEPCSLLDILSWNSSFWNKDPHFLFFSKPCKLWNRSFSKVWIPRCQNIIWGSHCLTAVSSNFPFISSLPMAMHHCCLVTEAALLSSFLSLWPLRQKVYSYPEMKCTFFISSVLSPCLYV